MKLRENKTLAGVVLLHSQVVPKSRHEPKLCEEFRLLRGWSGATLPGQYLIFCSFYKVKHEINNCEELLMSEKLFSKSQ